MLAFLVLLWDHRTVIFQLSGFYRVSACRQRVQQRGLSSCGLLLRGLYKLQPYSNVPASFGRFLSAICLGALGSNVSIWAKFMISRTLKTYQAKIPFATTPGAFGTSIAEVSYATPRECKYPILKDSDPKNHTLNSFLDQSPSILATWTLWDAAVM